VTAPAFVAPTAEYPEYDPRPLADDDAPAGPAPVDPDAPYGRKPDGTPYRMPADERASIGERLRAAKAAKAPAGPAGAGRRQTRRSAAPPPRKSGPAGSSSPPRVTAAVAKDYRPALTLLLSIPTALLAALGRHNQAFALDAVAFTLHSPDLVQAGQEAAEQDARIAALLDKMTAVTPYGALAAALMPLALQLAHNHGVMPAVPELGVYSSAELIAELERRSGTAGNG
jgi:hypothetical protein